VGPKRTIMGIFPNDNICIIPLSMEIAKSSLFPKLVTKAGEDKFVSCSGKSDSGINVVIFFFNSLFFF